MTDAEEALARFHPHTAWTAYFPNAANTWDEVKVAHLYRRACGGASWEQIQAGVKSTPDELVGRLMAGAGGAAEGAFEHEVARLRDGVLDDGNPLEARALWLYRILNSPHPLREWMTLFWHGHFATSDAKVRNPRLMQGQNETLRRHALGHFDALLQDMTRDPAMLVWLDSGTNKKGSPNENYGRELMELFSLGIGHYTEKDVQEAARGLTGWEVRDGRTFFNAGQHDAGEKTVLGQTGRWAAGDVVRICLAQDACALFIVRKLFRFFVSETVTPGDALLKPLADGFRIRNYDVAWIVEQILKSWVFYSPAAIQQKVKSPCDFLVGLLRSLEGRLSLTELAKTSDQLGQSLFNPPSVKGWDGGPAWINSTTLLRRQNIAFEATRGTGVAARTDPARLVVKYGIGRGDNRADTARLFEEVTAFFLRLFHQKVDPAVVSSIVEQLKAERASAAGRSYSISNDAADIARSAAHLALTLPEYQLG